MSTKTLLTTLASGVLALGLSGSVVFAGERAGNGTATPAGEKAASACAFSGLEDFDFEEDVDPGVTQNWGQIVREFGPLGGANSVQTPFGEEGCNALTYPNK